MLQRRVWWTFWPGDAWSKRWIRRQVARGLMHTAYPLSEREASTRGIDQRSTCQCPRVPSYRWLFLSTSSGLLLDPRIPEPTDPSARKGSSTTRHVRWMNPHRQGRGRPRLNLRVFGRGYFWERRHMQDARKRKCVKALDLRNAWIPQSTDHRIRRPARNTRASLWITPLNNPFKRGWITLYTRVRRNTRRESLNIFYASVDPVNALVARIENRKRTSTNFFRRADPRIRKSMDARQFTNV